MFYQIILPKISDVNISIRNLNFTSDDDDDDDDDDITFIGKFDIFKSSIII